MTTLNLKKNSCAGFSMVEFAIFLPVVAIVGIWASNLLRKPVYMNRLMNSAQINNTLAQAGDTMTQDIQGAMPSSVNWSQVPPVVSTNTTTFAFSIPSYANNVAQDPILVLYSYENGSLVRLAGSVRTVLATKLDPPTVTYPLVQQDTTTLNVVTINLLYTPEGMPQTRIVRRATLRT